MFLDGEAGLGRVIVAVFVALVVMTIVVLPFAMKASSDEGNDVSFRGFVVMLLSQPLVLVRDFKEAFQQRKR